MSTPARLLPEYRSEHCLNCGTPLEKADKFCHQCGQINSKKRLSLLDFFSEFLSNFISYDSRIWRTISGVLFKPGRVTQEYCAGRRISYANPFRFFLTVSIVFFLLVQLAVNLDPDTMEPINVSNKNKEQFNNGFFNVTIDSTVENREDLLNEIKKIQDSINENGSTVQKLLVNQAVEKMENDSTPIRPKENFHTQAELDSMNFISRYFNQIESYSNYNSKYPQLEPRSALKQLNHRVDNSNLSRYIKASKLQNTFDNPVFIAEILLPKIPLFLFFFAPLLSLVFWLLYSRRPFNYMEHMVFNFHLLTFIFLSFYIMLAELALIGTEFIAYLFFGLLGPFYLYKAMRNFYGQGRIKTILKFLIINFVFLVLILLSGTVFILLSIFLSL